jgi:tetratricopeptide (TPR) repeat protein
MPRLHGSSLTGILILIALWAAVCKAAPATETEFRAALKSCQSTNGAEPCADFPMLLNGLGLLYYSAGRYGEAEPLLARAVEFWSSGDQNPADLAAALHNLAAVYRSEAKYAQAAPLYERALRLRESLAGPASATLLPLLNGLALLYQDLGDYRSSRTTIDQAVFIVEFNHLEDSRDAAVSFANLGRIHQAEGSLADAERWLRKALDIEQMDIEQGLHIPEPAWTVGTMSALAVVYRQEGRLAEASEMYRSALAVSRDKLARPDTGVLLNDLGRVLEDQGRLNEAEQLFRQAVAASERQFGPHHPDVAGGLANLGNLLSLRHKYAEAESLLRRAQEIDRKSFPEGHPRLATDLYNLATLALARKQNASAEGLYKEALKTLQSRPEADHPADPPEIGKTMAGVAEACRRQGHTEEAERYYRESLRILTRAWGAESPELLSILRSYAAVLRARQEYAEAASVDMETMRIQVTQARKSFH